MCALAALSASKELYSLAGEIESGDRPVSGLLRESFTTGLSNPTDASKWVLLQVLVGPSDWRDHAAGKEGVQRYRVQNLPGSHCGPGVYELGVTGPAWLPVQQDLAGLGSNKLRSKEVVAVFVGQSDNVRQRLQRYGQSGGHLEGAK
jgi:hypothetical protein